MLLCSTGRCQCPKMLTPDWPGITLAYSAADATQRHVVQGSVCKELFNMARFSVDAPGGSHGPALGPAMALTMFPEGSPEGLIQKQDPKDAVIAWTMNRVDHVP